MSVKSIAAIWFLPASLIFGAGPLTSAKAELVDRVVVVAAGRAVTWSAALTDANCQAFLTRQPPVRLGLNDPGALEQLRPAIDRLRDQIIMDGLRQRSQLGADTGEDVDAGVERMWQELLAGYSSPDEFRRALLNYGLDEQTLRARLAREKRILAFVDYSLRPQTRVQTEQIETYYQEEFLPKFRQEQSAAEVPTLDEVRSQVEEILVQREINLRMGPWLESLRKEEGVRVVGADETLSK